ncbi:hypothetical protein F5884DRAFT_821239 [Xylogone sp. PMI_703]|nr:hypothetical protein F5884DRAFT_821239 [Xylogone sp. PMI_703]
MKRYSKAHENRVPANHPSVLKARHQLLRASFKNLILLAILFFGLFAYLFGALYQQQQHTHNFTILFVDYDTNGAVGTAIRQAYNERLEGSDYPTVIEKSVLEFPTPADIRREVCSTRYWAGLYTSSGASGRIETALTTGGTYNKANILSYVWNEARYPAVVDSYISGNLQTLSSTAATFYASGNWTSDLSIDSTPNTFSIFAQPWTLTSVHIQQTNQGSRLIYNTLVIILMIIQQFFFLGTINALYEAFKIYSRLNPHRVFLFRLMLSLIYTFLGSLCVTGAVWAYRVNWKVNGNQFVLSWMAIWLFAHCNFLTLDVFTVWLPPPFVPMALITWVVFNVGAILVPFELSPGFYKWAYVMPAHEVYETLVDIWSHGCNPHLRYTLPVLFSLEISGLLLSALGIHRRAHYATIKEESDKAAFQGRIDAALRFERQRLEERLREERARAGSVTSTEISPSGIEEGEDEEAKTRAAEKDKEDLAEVIRQETRHTLRAQTRSQSIQFGPSFAFTVGAADDSQDD